jgi:hypothetical protein
MAATVVLDLRDLESGIPALTQSLGRVHAEAAAVCLDDRGHREPVGLVVRKVDDPHYSLRWPDVSQKMQRAYNDLERATELGACGVALLLIRQLTGLKAIQAAKKGGGFDYWLASGSDEEQYVFANEARLEVSGILSGTDSQFLARVRQKVKQLAPSDGTGLAAYAVVVEFGKPQAEVAKR